MIADSFGRIHDYMRISLTDNCNFRCFYCMPGEEYDFTPASRLMQTDKIIKLAEIFIASLKKIRLRGGEPLIRKLLLQHKIKVKINKVVMKGLKDSEINDFIRWTKHNPIQVRFIEFMPFSGNKWMSNKMFYLEKILIVIEKDFTVLPVKGEPNDTAKHFMISESETDLLSPLRKNEDVFFNPICNLKQKTGLRRTISQRFRKNSYCSHSKQKYDYHWRIKFS